MAIAFGRAATLTATTSPIAPAIVLNAGETGVVFVTLTPASCAVTGITNGGTWTKRGEIVNGSVKLECWSTAAGGALAATSVSVAISGTITDADVQVLAYTGPLGLGATNTNTGTSAAGTVALTTQDPNNWVVAGLGVLSPTTSPTNSVGTNRLSDQNVAISAAASDNTAASPASVTNTYVNTSAAWAAFALELRTVAASVASGLRLTRYAPGRRGPQSRRGPYLNERRNAAYVVAIASASLAGTCRAAGLLFGAALSSGLTLTPAPVRAHARATSSAITQAQPVAGTLRSAPRAAGSLSVALSIGGTSRSVARVPGATLAQSVAVAGSTRTEGRLCGATLAQAQPIASTARTAPRLTGALAQAQSVAGSVRAAPRATGVLAQSQAFVSTVRSLARLPAVALSLSVPGATVITGTSRTSARLSGATITQAVGVVGRLGATGRTVGQLAQAVPLRGTTRTTPRLAGVLVQAQAVRSTVRGWVRLLGTLATAGGASHTPAYIGAVTTAARLTGVAASRPELLGTAASRGRLTSPAILGLARLTGTVTTGPRFRGTITLTLG